MTARPWPGRRAWLVVLALLTIVGLWLRLRNALADLDALSATTLPDDAFYDFGIARNLAHGRVPSIDGVHATNGYHPLWVALLTVIFRFVSGVRAPVHVALVLGALLDVAAMLLLARIARRIGLRCGAWIVVALWAIDPYCVVNATCGLETPLALLVLLLLVDRALVPLRRATPRSAAILGALAGLAVLARTDSLIVAAPIVIAALWRRPPIASARLLAAASAAALVVVSPWLLWSLHTTGTIVQSSALTLALVARRMPEVWGFHDVPWSLRVDRVLASIEEAASITTTFFGLGPLGTCAAAGALASTVIVSRRRGRVPGPTRKAHRVLALQLVRLRPLLVGLLLLFASHAAIRCVFNNWYTAPIVAGMTLLAGVVADRVVRGVRRPAWAAFALAAFVALELVDKHRTWRARGLYLAADYRDMHPTPGLHEGHTDCGAVAYFSQTGITNLDGVVNAGALDALRDGRLLDYLRAEKFDRVYATDHYHSSVFFGPRYRESLRATRADVRAVQLVGSDAEKDALVALGDAPIWLGSAQGRELLDDGWLWIAEPPPGGWSISLGHASELLVSLPDGVNPSSAIELELRAVVTGERDVQRVDLRFDDRPVASFDVGRSPRAYVVPVGAAGPGRHRIELSYASARAVREVGPRGSWDWWRALRGSMIRAIEAGRIRFLADGDLPLPPAGPSLASTESDRLLVSGWLAVERDHVPPGVWAVGDRAIVSFGGETNAEPRTLTLVAGPPPPEGARDDQTITVALNGVALGSVVLRPAAVEAHALVVPVGALRHGTNRLELSFARTQKDPESTIARAAYVQALELR